MDCAVAVINSRFITPGLDLACAVERLLLEGAGGQVNDALLKQVTEHYKDDLNPGRLERQLLFLSDMRETKKLEVKRLSDLTDMFSGTDTAIHMKEVVPLVKLLLVLPSSSSCSAERSFSALHRLKTYIRSTMSVSKLNHVTVLHIHKTLTDELNIISIVNAFASDNNARKDTFG